MQTLFWSGYTLALKPSVKPPIKLPIEWKGVVKWAPYQGFIPIEQVKRGEWASVKPQPVTVCASRARSGGVWFQIRQGIQGFLLRGKEGKPVLYILTAPSTHYFKTMTGAQRMPVLIGQII